jgi:hypothetical protein
MKVEEFIYLFEKATHELHVDVEKIMWLYWII